MLRTNVKAARETRFSIRTTLQQKELITRAAARLNKTVSEFMLENAMDAAEALELDQGHFVVSREKYEAFLAALDEPTKPIPALQRLFSGPGVLDDPKN